jgi:CheY-like chemotaxis protein
MNSNQHPDPLKILLADDDRDDRFFFEKALKTLTLPTQFATVIDGEKLMISLLENADNLPDVLFLDLNMPRKNGTECLLEIKSNIKLKELPVIIYSTSLHDAAADLLYNMGAYHYVQKTDLAALEKVLQYILILMLESKFVRPSREEFILGMENTIHDFKH